MSKIGFTLRAAFVATSIILLTGIPIAANADSPPSPPEYPQLSAQEVELFNSAEPSIVAVDVQTGAILSVKPATANPQPKSVYPNNCTSGKSCWYSAYAPGAYYGFTPGGINTGSWASRSDFYTNSYTSQPCWSTTPSGQLICAPYRGPGNIVTLVGTPPTGRRVNF